MLIKLILGLAILIMFLGGVGAAGSITGLKTAISDKQLTSTSAVLDKAIIRWYTSHDYELPATLDANMLSIMGLRDIDLSKFTYTKLADNKFRLVAALSGKTDKSINSDRDLPLKPAADAPSSGSGSTTPTIPSTPDTGNTGDSGNSGTTTPDTGNTGDSGNSGGTSGGDSSTTPTTPDTGNTGDSGSSSTIIDTSSYKPGDVITEDWFPINRFGDKFYIYTPFEFYTGDRTPSPSSDKYFFVSDFAKDIQSRLTDDYYTVCQDSYFLLTYVRPDVSCEADRGTIVSAYNAEAGLFYCFLINGITASADEAKKLINTDWEHGGELSGDAGFVMKIK